MKSYQINVEEVYLIFLEETRFFIALDELYTLADEVLFVIDDVLNASDHKISITHLIVIELAQIYLLIGLQHLPIDLIQYIRTQRCHLVQIRQQAINQFCQCHMRKHLYHLTRIKHLKQVFNKRCSPK